MGKTHEKRNVQTSRPSPRASLLPAPETALVIFAKAPIPGQVKTRLCPPLTPDEAASLHGSLVLDVLERSGSGATPTRNTIPRYDRFLACAPASEHVFFQIMAERHRIQLIDQIGDDLGSRMEHAFNRILSMGYHRALLIGTDLPTLPGSCFSEADALLTRHDVVLGPTEDGGYYLIGLKKPAPELFGDISWSTDQVLLQTKRMAERLGLTTALLPALRDLDTMNDFNALLAEIGLDGTSRQAKKQSRSRREAGGPAIVLSKRTESVLRLLAERLCDRGNEVEG